MKLVSAEYVGLADGFTRVKVVMEIKGRERKGFLEFENDGRDVNFEGEIEPFQRSISEYLFTEDSEEMKLLTREVQKGTDEYDSLGSR